MCPDGPELPDVGGHAFCRCQFVFRRAARQATAQRDSQDGSSDGNAAEADQPLKQGRFSKCSHGKNPTAAIGDPPERIPAASNDGATDSNNEFSVGRGGRASASLPCAERNLMKSRSKSESRVALRGDKVPGTPPAANSGHGKSHRSGIF